MVTLTSHNRHKMGTGNRRMLSCAYVSVTMIHSACLRSTGSPNRSCQTNARKTRSKPQFELRTQCSLLLHTAGLHTQTYSYQQLPEGREWGIGRRPGVREGRQSESPPPQCLSGDKSRPAHSAPHQSRSYQTGFCSCLEHWILLAVTEVTALRRRTHNKLRSVFQLDTKHWVCVSTSGVLACVNVWMTRCLFRVSRWHTNLSHTRYQ